MEYPARENGRRLFSLQPRPQETKSSFRSRRLSWQRGSQGSRKNATAGIITALTSIIYCRGFYASFETAGPLRKIELGLIPLRGTFSFGWTCTLKVCLWTSSAYPCCKISETVASESSLSFEILRNQVTLCDRSWRLEALEVGILPFLISAKP